MLASINQPAYLPWLGYFERIARSDVHIVLDHVQFEKNSFTNRNKVRTADGWCWLTVPVKTKGRFGAVAINGLEISKGRWARKHWDTLRFAYARAPHFASHVPFFEDFYARQWERFSVMVRHLTAYLLGAFEIKTPIHYSSEMECQGTKDELILDLCRRVGADHYLSGALGRNYLRESIFQPAGIRVSYQDYKHPSYAQLSARGAFQAYMACVDLLFNHGPHSREILLGSSSVPAPPESLGPSLRGFPPHGEA